MVELERVSKVSSDFLYMIAKGVLNKKELYIRCFSFLKDL